jgi:hypothetical protein
MTTLKKRQAFAEESPGDMCTDVSTEYSGVYCRGSIDHSNNTRSAYSVLLAKLCRALIL